MSDDNGRIILYAVNTMKNLSAVSETALLTLKSRVQESEREAPVIEDPIGKICLERVRPQLSPEKRKNYFDRKLPTILTVHLALRARKYDTYAREFIEENPDGLVISLGSGFDTRYWRISEQPWNYVELDLPEVVAAKKDVLGDYITYPIMGCSVLDEQWVAEIQQIQSEKILFLAEGLLMYLPKQDVLHLFNMLASGFSNSQFAFEVVHERYTKGWMKKGVERKMKRNFGIDAGASYQFGIKDAQEIEAFAPKLNVVDEWSYFEDEDLRPKVMKLFKNFKFVAKTQWTIKITIA